MYHVAATYRTAGQPDQAYRAVNVEGTRALLDAALAAGARRFVHCSTGGVHGHVERPPADEDAPFAPGDVYQETKLAGERLARAAGETGRMEVVVVRPIGIYGPGDTRFLKMFRAVARRRFPLLGGGRVFYHLTYVDDLVEGFRLCGETPAAAGRTYLLAGPRYTTLAEFARLVAAELGVPPPRWRVPARPVWLAGALCVPLGVEPPLYRRRVDFFTKSRAFDTTRARRELDYRPAVDLPSDLLPQVVDAPYTRTHARREGGLTEQANADADEEVLHPLPVPQVLAAPGDVPRRPSLRALLRAERRHPPGAPVHGWRVCLRLVGPGSLDTRARPHQLGGVGRPPEHVGQLHLPYHGDRRREDVGDDPHGAPQVGRGRQTAGRAADDYSPAARKPRGAPPYRRLVPGTGMAVTPRRLNVVQICDHLGWPGTRMHGVKRLFAWMIPRFDAARFRVSLISLRAPDTSGDRLEDHGIDVTYLARSKFDPRTLPALLAELDRRGTDVVHLHGYGATTFGRLAAARRGWPARLHEHCNLLTDRDILNWFEGADVRYSRCRPCTDRCRPHADAGRRRQAGHRTRRPGHRPETLATKQDFAAPGQAVQADFASSVGQEHSAVAGGGH